MFTSNRRNAPKNVTSFFLILNFVHMNILVLGSGGREHALVWKLAQSAHTETIFAAPGNPGMRKVMTQSGPVITIPLDLSDFESIGKAVLGHGINLLVVGPEEPLVKGLRDYFESVPALRAVTIVGPGKEGARLEGSKDFAKRFMARHDIPTAAYRTFNAGEYEAACLFLNTLKPPYVLKADGLAAGKGVLIPLTLQQATQDLKELMGGKFGKAGEKVVIEEYLTGIEVSVFVLTDGKNYKILPEAKDYKRIGEHDTGPNTGGMGAVSPVVFADAPFMKKVEERIILPTIRGLAAEGIDYRGFIFFGLMNCQGDPFVIEYNVRMGDPETEAVMLRLGGDLAMACLSLGTQSLDSVPLSAGNMAAVTVVCVSGGYPDTYKKGYPISGLENVTGVTAFHMGTTDQSGLVTAGGRVLALSALGADPEEARRIVYSQIHRVSFNGIYYRNDIGLDLIEYGKG